MDWLTKEAVRYLGYKKHAVDAQTLILIEEAFTEIQKINNNKYIFTIFDLNKKEDGKLQFGNIETNSHNMKKALAGCDKVVLFAATLGTEIDRLQSRLSIINMAKAVVLQACAAAYLEQYCDECQRQIAEAVKAEGYYLRPRFSPGYGDFSIEYQKNIMQLLDCGKKIGLTVTDSCMLSPKKSITAVIGMSHTDEKCHQYGCEVCENTKCNFRRNDK